MRKYLGNLLQLLLSPAHGWEDIERAYPHAPTLAASGFYPLTALTALSVFAGKFYHADLALIPLLTMAIVEFTAFFLAYFIGTFILNAFCANFCAERPDENRIGVFTIYSLGLMELVTIIYYCVPVLLALTIFLPVYIGIIMWKGRQYMQVMPHSVASFMLAALGGIMVPYYLIIYIFKLVLPQ